MNRFFRKKERLKIIILSKSVQKKKKKKQTVALFSFDQNLHNDMKASCQKSKYYRG